MAFLSSKFHFPRLTQLPLGVEITCILIVKIALLFILAKAFFSEPQAKKMRVPTYQVEQHMLGTSSTSSSNTINVSPIYPTSSSKADHDTH